MERFRIVDREFLPEICELRRNDEIVHLQFQVRNVLLCLVRHRGDVVDKATLLKEAWGGRRASEESLARCISLLRREFDREDGASCIETIPKVGYRLRVEEVFHPVNAGLHAPARTAAGETGAILFPRVDAHAGARGREHRSHVLTHALAFVTGAALSWVFLYWFHLL